MTLLSRPAASWPVSNGPSASWRAQRPQRMRKASPGPHAHAGHLLPRLQVRDRDAGTRLQPRHALEPRDVVEHAARHQAVLHGHDGVLLRALLHRHQAVDVVAVPHLAVEEDVGEGVEVRRARPVDARVADRVAGGPAVGHDHRPLDGARVVYGAVVLGVRRQRDGEALRDERGRLGPLGRRDQVGRAQLVVGTPAAPVRELGQPRVELLGGSRAAGGRPAPARADRRRAGPRRRLRPGTATGGQVCVMAGIPSCPSPAIIVMPPPRPPPPLTVWRTAAAGPVAGRGRGGAPASPPANAPQRRPAPGYDRARS